MLRSLYTIVLAALASSAIAQLQAPGNFITAHGIETMNGDRLTTIWSQDFSSGIPSTWVNEEENGIAAWEYRGPLTNPGVDIGTRGSCVEAGTTGTPIQSPTRENGFIIFDSNYWDNPDNPCTLDNFGTGSAPGPHYATLTTDVINLTDYEYTALTFHQYIRFYQGLTRIEVSINGGAWAAIFENDLLNGETSPTDEFVFVPLGPNVGGEMIQLRFIYDGQYYFWQIDDVEIVTILQNNLESRQATYGDFDILDPNHPTGFEFMEYSQYPNEMPPSLRFATNGFNIGALAQTDCRLAVEVTNENTGVVVHTGLSAEGQTIQPGNELELRSNPYNMGGTIAKYQIAYEVQQSQTDEEIESNRDTLNFRITDVVYARDRGATNSLYGATPNYDDTTFEMGNVFLITAPSMQLHSIAAAVAIGTSLPATIYGALYTITLEEDFVITPVATTPAVEVTQEMLNDYGEEKMIELPFSAPINLTNGQAYIAMVGSENGPNNVYFAFNGDAPELTSWVKFLPNDLLFLTRTPLVRMHFGTWVGTEEVTPSHHLSLYPNPASEHVTIDMTGWEKGVYQLEVINAVGQVIHREQINATEQSTYMLSVENLASGLYTLRVAGGDQNYTSSLIVH